MIETTDFFIKKMGSKRLSTQWDQKMSIREYPLEGGGGHCNILMIYVKLMGSYSNTYMVCIIKCLYQITLYIIR